MTVNANTLGIVRGKFRVPANIPAGSKSVKFYGANGSYGESKFTGVGTLVTQMLQRVTEITTTTFFAPPPPPVWWGVDPVAQTFTPDEDMTVSGIEVFFENLGALPVRVMLARTENGVPARNGIFAEKTLNANQLQPAGPTRFTFDIPVRVNAGSEYAFIVMTRDVNTTVGVAKLGKFDSVKQQWVTSQPYQVGVMLSSSNASTWTPQQDQDLTFKIIQSKFTSRERTVELGSVSVVDATDLVLLPVVDVPRSDAGAEFDLTLPDGTILTVADRQKVALRSAVTGNIGIRARLRSTENFSATLLPGTQLLAGTQSETGTYITRAVPAGANTTLKVFLDASLPSGAALDVEYQADGGTTWTSMGVPSAKPGSFEGFVEFSYAKSGITDAAVRVRLTLRGNAGARPRIRNLSVLAV